MSGRRVTGFTNNGTKRRRTLRRSAQIAKQRLSFPPDDEDDEEDEVDEENEVVPRSSAPRNRHTRWLNSQQRRRSKRRRIQSEIADIEAEEDEERELDQVSSRSSRKGMPIRSRQNEIGSSDHGCSPSTRNPKGISASGDSSYDNKENDGPETPANGCDEPVPARRTSLRRSVSDKARGKHRHYGGEQNVDLSDNLEEEEDELEPGDTSVDGEDVPESEGDEKEGVEEGLGITDEENEAEDDDVVMPRYSLRRRVSKQEAETGTPLSSLHSMRFTRGRSSASRRRVLEEMDEMDRLRAEQAKERARLDRAMRRARRAGESLLEQVDDRDPEDDADGAGVRRSGRTRTITQRFVPVLEEYLPNEKTAASASSRPRSSTHGSHHRSRRRGRRTQRATMSSAPPSDSDMSSGDSELFGGGHHGSRGRRRGCEGSSHRLHSLNMPMDVDDCSSKSNRRRRKTALADVDPLQIDPTVKFDSVGGLDRHIESLKEMVVLPLLYPELFKQFRITAPRGVLFFGPPGTGKTLTARALANSCSDNGQKVAFFMRKGADCLSKWVGEAERQLRLLFEQAYEHRPSIIFFDEIDGLAPVRSSRQDQIHSSIVSTLLALMDGLDDRGQVIVIGATNRIDSIDPALRRPGRFDRELCFSLPCKSARRAILKVHTAKWEPPLDPSFVDLLADRCVGYGGADIKALCTEASLRSIRRRFPQIYSSTQKLQLEPSSVLVEPCDFLAAMKTLTPASHRSCNAAGRSLPPHLQVLLRHQLDAALATVASMFPLGAITPSATAESTCLSDDVDGPIPVRPRLLLEGAAGSGHTHMCTAILDALEEYAVYPVDLASLLGDAACRSPEEALLRAVAEARRSAPSIIYWPHAQLWWTTATAAMRATLTTLLQDLPSSAPVLLLSSVEQSFQELDQDLAALFGQGLCTRVVLRLPSLHERQSFFRTLAPSIKCPVPRRQRAPKQLQELKVAEPSIEAAGMVKASTSAEKEEDEKALRALRMFLRALCTRLLSEFKVFAHPVDAEREPGYYRIITNPLCIDEIRHRCNTQEILCVSEFLASIDLLVQNVRSYFTDESAVSRSYINKACQLQDFAIARVTTFNSDTAELCEAIAKKRRAAGWVGLPDPKVLLQQHKESAPAQSQSQTSPRRSSSRLRSQWPSPGVDTKQTENDVEADHLDSEVPQSDPGDMEQTEQKPAKSIADDDHDEMALEETKNVDFETDPEAAAEMETVVEEPREELVGDDTAQEHQQTPGREEEFGVEEVEEEEEEDVSAIVDDVRMQEVLQKMSESCENCTVDELEMHHLSMFKLAHTYRHQRDRSELLEKLYSLAMLTG